MRFIATRKADRFWRIRSIGETYEVWFGKDGTNGTIRVTYIQDDQCLETQVKAAFVRNMAKGYKRCEADGDFRPLERILVKARQEAETSRLPKHVGYDRVNNALSAGNAKKLSSLFRSGISADVRPMYDTDRAFHSAILMESRACVETFLMAGATVRSVMGDTPPIAIAVRRQKNDQSEIVRLLLEAGADPNERPTVGDWIDKPCLHYGVEGMGQSNAETIRLIVDAGYALSGQDTNGNTALHIASEWSEVEMASLLIDFGIGLDIENGRGQTAYDICRGQVARHPRHVEAPVIMESIATAGGKTTSGNRELDLLRSLLEPLDRSGASYKMLQAIRGFSQSLGDTGVSGDVLGEASSKRALDSIVSGDVVQGLLSKRALDPICSGEVQRTLSKRELGKVVGSVRGIVDAVAHGGAVERLAGIAEQDHHVADTGAAFLIRKGVGSPFEALYIGHTTVMFYAAKVGLPRVVIALVEQGVDVCV